MGMDPISAAMLGLSGFSAWQTMAAGEESQEAYNKRAAEVAQQSAYQRRVSIEEMKELDRTARSEVGRVVATAGKSGLRVGGSVVTLTQAINAKLQRRKALMNLEANEQARQSAFEIDELRRTGRKVRRASQIGAFGTLLTGGLAVANRMSQLPRRQKNLSPYLQRARSDWLSTADF